MIERISLKIPAPSRDIEVPEESIRQGWNILRLLNRKGLPYESSEVPGIKYPQFTHGCRVSTFYSEILRFIGSAYRDSGNAITTEDLGISYSELRKQVKTLEALGHNKLKRRGVLADCQEANQSAQKEAKRRDYSSEIAVPTPGNLGTWPTNGPY